jgi:hypothetical protein
MLPQRRLSACFQGFSEDGVPPKVNIADERSAGRAYPPIGFDEIGSLPCSPLPVGEADTVVLEEGLPARTLIGSVRLGAEKPFHLGSLLRYKGIVASDRGARIAYRLNRWLSGT